MYGKERERERERESFCVFAIAFMRESMVCFRADGDLMKYFIFLPDLVLNH